jgi:hypothetical protein
MNSGNYVAKIVEKADQIRPMLRAGHVTHVNILHDGWCGIFSGKPCNCDPDVHVPAARANA